MVVTRIEEKFPLRLADVDLTPRGRVHPSPQSWRDQFLYQLLPDRFSDGRESSRPLYDSDRPEIHRTRDKTRWMNAGRQFMGGTIRGIQSKLDYLQNLGVTALWLNPPWRQRAEQKTYHGYGIQNFLDIDPRFGTRQDLRNLVDAAHDRGMYVILDVIYNHSGSNWFYRDESTGEPCTMLPYRGWPPYAIHGYRTTEGKSIAQPVNLDDGVWPEEFQNPDWYTRAGQIVNWDRPGWEDPMSPMAEYRRGDFFELRDLNLENPEAIAGLIEVYQYWIAVSDCDGFRVDAVKHVSPQDSYRFCLAIHEYAQYIGKDNFLLTGEITDLSMVAGYMDMFGRNLDAVLDIIVAPNALTSTVKGLDHPSSFFDLFDATKRGGTYRQIGFYHVSVLDDHDMSSRPRKDRFAAHGDSLPNRYQQVAHAVGVQLTMPGIPSLYYGTEQAFDGSEDYHDYSIEPEHAYIDRYIRESMFGSEFGAFGTEGCHFFNPDHPTYLRIAAIAKLRNGDDRVGKALRRGHHYLRETSFAGYPFGIPGAGELLAWSQILFDIEVIVVLNTHGLESRGAAVTVDSTLHPVGSDLTVLYRGDWSDTRLRNPIASETLTVETAAGRAIIRAELPPSGMLIAS
ncbi:glycosidase [Rubidibacter lacunae KORDI 51-2]|uniref:Glycosidase n=1 Tax=Rubidibacter lacunae KORDI 51-2 TaxID=582515 RepID=U5DKK8_9CHRO|nr:alpha-amylase family glycosyl hydrolase [Rubidibacter lacunae]ERN41447.1 glycosidase [Rubidibacter lacunae KORDI 51-2]